MREVSIYMATRRGNIEVGARTRLAEAKRLGRDHTRYIYIYITTDPTEAIAYANAASMLTASGQSLANADVQSAQRAYTRRTDSDTGGYDQQDNRQRPAKRRFAKKDGDGLLDPSCIFYWLVELIRGLARQRP